MKAFKGQVAIITGAASGIGYGLAERCAREGMKVVLADVEQAALSRAEGQVRAAGTETLAVRTDVSKREDVEALAQKTLDAFGAVHLVFNNAGVTVPTNIWKSTWADWEWVIGVNLWGVIHGVRVFVPIMLDQGTECHIVNVASIHAVMSGPASGIYKVTKHGVLTLSETLYHELIEIGAKIGVSVLVPGRVESRLADAERNRPREEREDPVQVRLRAENARRIQRVLQTADKGGLGEMSPERVAEVTFNGIRRNLFYILPDPKVKFVAQLRMEDLLLERNPTNPLVSRSWIRSLLLKTVLPLPGWGSLLTRGARARS